MANFPRSRGLFIWLGIFIWGDGIVLGLFLTVGGVVLWWKNDSIVTGLFFSTYASIRVFIEILYNLNAQFSTTPRPWERDILMFAASWHIQPVELYVMAQIAYSAMFVSMSLVLMFYLKKYFSR